MATIFLTSSPTGPLDGSRQVDGLDKMNYFAENLKNRWKENSANLMITAFPSSYEASEEMTDFFRRTVEKEGLTISCFDLLDDRNQSDFSREKLQAYDVIWLGGGHVPTQNRFFQSLGLREKLEGFTGMIIGISAGSMNSADLVYAEPEEEGEAIDPSFEKFLSGLNLTRQMILPHYQMVKDKWLDGKRLFEDIVFPDSRDERIEKILNLPDGSYLLIEGGNEMVYGEAWLIRDGRMDKICENKQVYVL